MLLAVEAAGRAWLADVGFGAGGLLKPVPLAAGPVSSQPLDTFRLVECEGLWVLQSRQGAGWQDLYAFTREPQLAVDFEVSNYYTSTYPESIFVRTMTAQRQSLEQRWTLRGRELVVEAAGREEKQIVTGAEELRHLLSETFGLDFKAGDLDPVFRATGG
jgi:N-hydroxyarylamine O-acetyltransferase